MISMAGISRLENAIQKNVETFQSSPEYARLVNSASKVVEPPTSELSQRLDEVVSTLEIFTEAYSRPNDDDPVRSMSNLLCILGVQVQRLGKIAEDLRTKE